MRNRLQHIHTINLRLTFNLTINHQINFLLGYNTFMASTSTSGAGIASSSGVVYTERVKNKRIVKPIIYGNRASQLAQKNKENHTHKWMLYVKPYDPDEDLSLYIRKIQFRLHESYANNVRIVEKPPFEITETGWGEFDAQMKLYFIDVNEKPVTVYHYIRLHQPLVTLKNGNVIVQRERYDEIEFIEPTEPMYRALMKFHNYKKDPQIEQERHQTGTLLKKLNKDIVAEIEDLRCSLNGGYELLQKYRQELAEEEQDDGNEQQSVS